MSTSFSPINKNNAIAEIVFYFNFTENLHQNTLRKIEIIASGLKNKLPHVSKIERLEERITQENGEPSISRKQETCGYELRSVNDLGDDKWVILLSENKFGIHCLEYSNWENIWSDANSYILSFWETLKNQSDLCVTSCGLQILDRFLGKDGLIDSPVKELFSQDSSYLTKKSFEKNNICHCHSGWAQQQKSKRLVNQINIDVSVFTEQDNSRHIVSIEHNAVILPMENQVIELVSLENELNVIFNDLHKSNKDVLSDLLTEKMNEILKRDDL